MGPNEWFYIAKCTKYTTKFDKFEEYESEQARRMGTSNGLTRDW